MGFRIITETTGIAPFIVCYYRNSQIMKGAIFMWIIDKFNKKRKEMKDMNFNKLADEWLEYKKNTVKKSTYFHYMSLIENHLKPNFIDINFNEVINYNEYIQNLSKQYSSKTVREIIAILKAIFKYYGEEYNCNLRIKKSNIPKADKKQIKIFTKKEKEKIINYCLEQGTLKAIGIIVCLNTGLRIGEICGLKWKYIDLDEKVLYVRHTAERVYDKRQKCTKIILDKPKTLSSIRTIPISKKLYEILKPIKKKYKEDDFLLSGTEKCIEPRTYQRYFEEMLKKLKIKKRKFHTTRHTFACDCLDIGMDIKTLSEILGHSNIEITLNTYIHSSNKRKRKFLEKL